MADAAAKCGGQFVQPEEAHVGIQVVDHQSGDNDQERSNKQDGHNDAACVGGAELLALERKLLLEVCDLCIKVIDPALVVGADLLNRFGILHGGAGRLTQTVAGKGGQQRLNGGVLVVGKRGMLGEQAGNGAGGNAGFASDILVGKAQIFFAPSAPVQHLFGGHGIKAGRVGTAVHMVTGNTFFVHFITAHLKIRRNEAAKTPILRA